MTTDVYLVATSTEPSIVCPQWCDMGLGTHLNDLEGLEGRVIHSGGGHIIPLSRKLEGLFDVRVYWSTLADGSPDPDDREPVLNIEGNEATLKEAKEIAMCLLELVEELS
jgi:hypothetical protein